MIAKMHLWQEELQTSNGFVTIAATLEKSKQDRVRLWYRLPETYAGSLSRVCDPFVVGTTFAVMRQRADLHVHGQVSPSLLRNLEEFQNVWASWRPNVYKQIEITAEPEREFVRAVQTDCAICAFSGGVDSSFTAWRHSVGNASSRSRQNLKAGLMVQGFDIGLAFTDVFERAATRSAKMLSSIGMNLITMATNFRELGDYWEDAFCAGVVSCMMVLEADYAYGLVGSGYSHHNLNLPHGSNPITDVLLSSAAFTVIHDGAAVRRIDKIRALTQWQEAMQYLRVCWAGQAKDSNCCLCRKCIRTMMEFRALGLEKPPCFENDINALQILLTSGGSEVEFLDETLAVARANGISDSWSRAARLSLWTSRLRQMGKQMFVR